MSEWQPDSSVLTQLVEVLSKNDADTGVQQLVFAVGFDICASRHVFLLTHDPQYVNDFMKSIDSFRYLSYVLIQKQLNSLARSKAGLLLKSHVERREVLQNLAQHPDIVYYIKQCAFRAVSDDDAQVRKTGTIVITGLVSADISHGPEALQVLLSLVDGANTNPEVAENLSVYLEGLYRRANDNTKEIVKHVCQGLVFAVEEFPEPVQDRMKDIIMFMLRCCDSGDDQVAVEACEFWLAFAETDSFCDYMDPYLGDDNDLMKMGPDKDDAHISDRAEDLAPVFHASKSHANEQVAEQKRMQKQAQKTQSGNADDDDDDLDLDDEDEDDDASEWTLRKCAAAALDVLANIYQETMLGYLLPILKESLSNPDWRVKEAGILALGAISEGCIRGMEVHLPELVKFMLGCLTDPKPLVRSITCWTLGRYSSWIVYGPEFSEAQGPHDPSYFEHALRGLLHMVMDNSKRVQEAGCSALATLEEVACEKLTPYLSFILGVLNAAFGKYQSKNLRILYDAVGTLADSVGEALNKPEFIPVLLQPLIVKWEGVTDDNRDIFPLFECLSAVAIALGPGFGPFAPNAAKRAVAANEQPEDVDIDFATVSLDLVSGMIQGLHEGSAQLVQTSDPPLIDLLLYCINEKNPDVRQSAFAVLGDMAIFLFEFIRPRLNQILPITIEQIKRRTAMTDFREMSASNNAIWATGEISLQLGAEIQPVVGTLLPELVHIVRLDKRAFAKGRTLQENAAITIGRLGLVCPAAVAPELENFILGWCEAVANMADNPEKESAFRGMCKMVALNPQGVFNVEVTDAFCIQQYLVYLCDAIVRWRTPSAELNEAFKTLLVDYKHNKLGPERWEAVSANFPVIVKDLLQRRYQI
ncbi:hypothetical protein HK405_008051 [Cladochytrium tenue]|nr:hypothetical protein HK405_008051 [Cladochytrium tenue]